MAQSMVGSTLASIPEDQPLPSTPPSSPVPEENRLGKWDTIKKLVKSHTLQFVGLEHPQTAKEHQEHLQRSIIVGKVQKRLERKPPTDTLTCDRSLVEAIVPHESVSPVTTHSLLRQLSIRADDTTPQTTPSHTGAEEIELQTIRPKLSTVQSEPGGMVGMATTQPRPRLEHSLSLPQPDPSIDVSTTTTQHQSTLKRNYLSKPTGRLEAEPETTQAVEPKPDLWKIAFMSLRFLSTYRSLDEDGPEDTLSGERRKRRRDRGGEEEEGIEGETDEGFTNIEEMTADGSGSALVRVPSQLQHAVESIDARPSSPEKVDQILFEDQNFFGSEATDGQIKRRQQEKLKAKEEEPPPDYESLGYDSGVNQRRKKKSGVFSRRGRHYRGHLGGISLRLLRFDYKNVKHDTRQKLDEIERPSLHRPFFTYWLMTVHILILVFSLSVYKFAPYNFVLYTERALVQQSNLAVGVEERNITPNVWAGPPQSALVLLGATYGPCMRQDKQLTAALDRDREREANNSGCCVRKDNSGCVQVTSRDKCPEIFSNFVYTDPDPRLNGSTTFTDRAVCGTSPLTCSNPDSVHDPRWELPSRITEWPICLESQTRTTNSEHLSCNITGRPCCVGIQSHCLITTLEHCDFLRGRFHPDAFLCSQVDCLGDICGLLPFAVKGRPDQVYRLLTAIFLHAGIIHLVFTLLFHFFVLRHVEKYLGWFRTTLIYLGSGIGGNMVSVVFVPYSPEVGPAGGIFGIIAFFLIYIMYQAHRLNRPWLEALKLLFIILILVCCGTFPFIDNFAHFGGFVFGILLSGIFVPYYRPLDAELAYYKDKHRRDYNWKKDWIQISKYLFLGLGIPVLLGLYGLFFALLYTAEAPWDGFRYLNCIPFSSTFCLNFGQNIRSRDIFL